jgi:4-hydroxy-3-polyprenylbenzoate decarboxylase
MSGPTKHQLWSEHVSERPYADLHDHLKSLDEQGLLLTVDIPICKDTEMHPLVRWQYRGRIPEEDRKAFLFTNVTDQKGRRYDIPVVVGALGANARVYGIGLGCAPEDADAKWAAAIANPIPPCEIVDAPCQEVVISGPDLDRPEAGLAALPVPISTPGWDNAPYFSTSNFITRDPDTGVQNLGNYRGMIKASNRLAMNPSIDNQAGGFRHWEKYKRRGERMPCAVVVGGPPVVSYTAAFKVPPSMDELTVAGGLVGAPINVVRAKTVDLLVPAEAEIVVEGYVDTEFLEPEGPFGENHGHVNMQEYNAFMDVTAITRRRDAILTSYVGQVPPSEGSSMRRPAQQFAFLRHLTEALAIRGVTRVSTHQPLTGNRKIIFVLFERRAARTEIWRALYGLASLQASSGKIIVALNDDIDPENMDAVLWAIAFRAKPHLDMVILPNQDQGHGPRDIVRGPIDSALLIDATLKHDFPPVSLPRREYMEHARVIWEERLGLPKLEPEAPWYGYSLGAWTDELEAEAQRAVTGDFWETGKIHAQRRRNDVQMNTEVRSADAVRGEGPGHLERNA